jgi:peroxiredoxin
MKRLLLTLTLMGAALTYPLAGANNKETGAMPKVGDLAPDFKMQYFDGHDLKDVTLAQYRGKKQVVLAFYVFAFTGG